jgi:hypothetical protein
MSKTIVVALIAGIVSIYQPVLAQNTENETIEISESAASFSLQLEDKNLETSDAQVDETTTPSEPAKEDSLGTSEVDDLTSLSEESSTPDDQNEAPAEPTKPAKLFLNPWLGVEENLLAEFLAQNWFVRRNLAQKRELLLAIAMEEKKDPRKFRRETELLLRDPGVCQIYSCMAIFPRLLLTDVIGSKQFIDSLSAKIIKDEMTPGQAIAHLKIRLQLSFALLEIFVQQIQEAENTLASFETITNRKTRISHIHNLIRKQNRRMIDNLGLQLQKTRKIASQHRLQLENALLHYQYLLDNIEMNKVLIASRLKRFNAIIGDTHQNLDDFFNKFTFFALKLKEDVAQFLADSEKLALQIDKNRFHIATALQKFPDRDLNPQKTESFKFSSNLQLIFARLDSQLQIFQEINKSEQAVEESFRDEFLQILDRFNNEFFASENFAELFSEIYEIESASQPENVELENSTPD